jgi:short-subunit dehydrogenase
MTERFTRLNARFPHKRVFITGASSGLGLELAKQLAADGWTLGLFDRNLERLTTVEAELADAGVKLIAYPGDVTHADELTVAVNSFAATHDGLDVMINNAGVAGGGSMMEVSLEDWRWIIDINVMGVVHGTRAAIPHLQRNGSGLLINIASAAAFASAPGMISYNATKAAVVSISETLVNELRAAGTQVCVVMPAFFRSSLLETLRGPEHARVLADKVTQRSQLSAEQAARDLLTAAADGQTYIVLPRAARTMWRMKRWMPLRFLDRVRDFTRRQPAD